MLSMSPHSQPNNLRQLTVIYAQTSPPEDKQCILENVAKEMHDYGGIDVQWYDKSRGVGPSEWVETNFRRSEKVLLVCNKEFKQEWENPNEEMIFNGAIVHASKQIIRGHINSTESFSSKYGLVFLKPSDLELIPDDYLKCCPKFLVNPTDRERSEQMAHFVQGIEEFCLPPRSLPSDIAVHIVPTNCM